MKLKVHVNYGLLIILAIMAILLVVSAYLLWIEFPRGYRGDRAFWVDIHKWVGFGLSIVVFLHVLLYTGWLWRMTRYYFRLARGRSNHNQ